MKAANNLEMLLQRLALAAGQQRAAILTTFAIPYGQNPLLEIQIRTRSGGEMAQRKLQPC